MLAGMIFCCCDGFFPLHFLTKFNSLTSNYAKSLLGNHLIPATLMLALSFLNVVGGSFPLNVTHFSENPPLFRTNSIWSALIIACFKFCAPDKQSSTYISFCTMWLTSGNSTADICAVSCSPLSDWLPLDFTPYINVLITFSCCIFFCSQVHFAKYTSESTSVLLVVEQCWTSFWHLCGNRFHELTSGLRFQPTCSYHSFPLLRCYWGLYQKQLVETHQIQDGMVCLLSCYSKLLSKGWSSELDSLSAFLVVLVSGFKQIPHVQDFATWLLIVLHLLYPMGFYSTSSLVYCRYEELCLCWEQVYAMD